MDWYQDILDFHNMAGQMPTVSTPHQVSEHTYKLRDKLIREEVNEELLPAMFESQYEEENLVKIADGIVDSIVVLIGTAIAYGIDIRPIWNEVHKTNMAKFKGGYTRPDGKVMKPDGWIPPDIKGELLKQGGNFNE